MDYSYYIINSASGKVLNKKGGWSDNFSSYRLASFETKEAAEAAIPTGIACKIIQAQKQNESNDTKFKYYLKNLNNKCYLNKSEEFKSYTASDVNAMIFDTEALALDKAESLNLDLDTIQVSRLFQPVQKTKS